MRALRLIVHQNNANYKKEETVENKMTYPLPPVSTIIGALHSICGYQEYKEMDISIQGKYESMHREPYTDYCFLNSVQDDRGILVKMRNGSMLSNAFDKVATAKKTQGNSFRKGITIHVDDKELLEEYRTLKNLNDAIVDFKKNRIAPVMELIKKRKKNLAQKKKELIKKTQEYERVENREKEIKELEKEIKFRLEKFQCENYEIPISRYRSLTKSMKFYEILDGVTLVLHVRAEDKILEDIMEHIHDLKSIGRSEDTVSIENVEIVELKEKSREGEIVSKYSAYIDCDMVKNERIYLREKMGRISGTKYYINKNYEIMDGKRIFSKKKVLYVSQYAADEFGDGLYVDEYEEEEFIVNFL
ncbi:MAG: CRISPR-associated protein Cas5 [Oliverpabstia sp.]|nr:CRISPR-associated protein Cas5 [Eubacterium sp.]MDY2596032.1 CRISPR-associated protein Cas5 [Oliverpabstia sp.]